MQRTIDERYKDFQAKAASNERAQRELRRVLDNLDKLPEQQSAADLLPIAEMEERLQYVNKLEKYWRVNFAWLSHKPEEVSRDFNDAELSGLLHMDTDYLRDNTARPQDMNTLIEDIQHFPLVLKIFATKSESLSKAESAAQENDQPMIWILPPSVSSASGDDEEEKQAAEKLRSTKFDSSGRACRNEYYLEKRKQLDSHRCAITGTRDPHVCHIVPYAANATENGRLRWKKVLLASMRLFMQDRPNDKKLFGFQDRILSLFTFERGVSDRHWNCISLSPVLDDWWGRGYYGLKYLGMYDANVQDADAVVALRIQFHWMPWRRREPGRKPAPLGRTKEGIIAAFAGSATASYCGNPESWRGEPIVAVSRPETGFTLETGDVFEVLIQRRHMERMIEAFRVQWALIKMLAMVGGAEAVEDVPDHPEFLDEDWRLPGPRAAFVRHWAQIAATEEEERSGGGDEG